MIELIYISRANAPLSEQALSNLLRTCRRNNSKLNISGLLLYDGGNTFIQLLEGEDLVVDDLYRKIASDNAHTDVHVLSQSTITTRHFSKWRMGFRAMTKHALHSITGCNALSEDDCVFKTLRQKPELARLVINYFKSKAPEETENQQGV